MICTFDFALFRLTDDAKPQVLVIKRDDKDKPFYGEYALVGGFIFEEAYYEGQLVDENDEQATMRILSDKAGFVPDFIIPCGRKGSRDRDPRGWSITFIHSCPVQQDQAEQINDSDKYLWIDVEEVLSNSFNLISDHNELVDMAWSQLKRTSAYSSAPLYLLPSAFTIKQLVMAYEALGIKVSKQTLVNRFVDSGLIEETGSKVSLKGIKHAGPRPKLFKISEAEPTYFKSAIG